MKKFFCFSTRQPTLRPARYLAVDNQRLHYGKPGEEPHATPFPIIPVINGYTEPGEEIEVIVITEDYPNSLANYQPLKEEIEALCREKNVSLRNGGVTKLIVPYGDGVNEQLSVFEKTVACIEDGDELYACITYGSKAGEVVELMALRYARQLLKNTYIACVAYGNFDFNTNKACIYDETALAHLDDILQVLAQHEIQNPSEAIRKILDF